MTDPSPVRQLTVFLLATAAVALAPITFRALLVLGYMLRGKPQISLPAADFDRRMRELTAEEDLLDLTIEALEDEDYTD